MKKIMGRYMVKSPFVIEPGASVREALELMRELEIRHLPVVEDDELKGLVSERDLQAAQAKSRNIPVSELMKTELYAVGPDASLAEVVGMMADQKLGSALVVSPSDEVLGIFTTIDALRLLHEMLTEEESEFTLDEFYEDWTELGAAREA